MIQSFIGVFLMWIMLNLRHYPSFIRDNKSYLFCNTKAHHKGRNSALNQNQSSVSEFTTFGRHIHLFAIFSETYQANKMFNTDSVKIIIFSSCIFSLTVCDINIFGSWNRIQVKRDVIYLLMSFMGHIVSSYSNFWQSVRNLMSLLSYS